MDEIGKKVSICHQKRQGLNYNCWNKLAQKQLNILACAKARRVWRWSSNRSRIFDDGYFRK